MYDILTILKDIKKAILKIKKFQSEGIFNNLQFSIINFKFFLPSC